MTQTVEMSEDSDQAGKIRDALTDKPHANGVITSVVEQAFRVVPRHELAPADTSLEVASAEVCGFVPMQGDGEHPERG